MLPKYMIEYSPSFKRNVPAAHYASDDPVACEEFLAELLERGFRINTIRHEGLELPRPAFDKMVKTAGSMVASKCIRTALGISAEEEHYRFGFAV